MKTNYMETDGFNLLEGESMQYKLIIFASSTESYVFLINEKKPDSGK